MGTVVEAHLKNLTGRYPKGYLPFLFAVSGQLSVVGAFCERAELSESRITRMTPNQEINGMNHGECHTRIRL
ncbi:MAG: hypothetical protein OXM61_03145 [Candidatus Poribacteria bacterium]|nr:hypothetical protein [Candidatus Poribacteria bacterium]